MIAILFLFIVAMIPVACVWLCIQAFRWLMKRKTGAEVQITPDNYFHIYRNIKVLWHHNPLDYEAEGQRKARKPKHNPHYERLIEQENAQRLDMARQRIREVEEVDTDHEPVQLGSLLQQDDSN